jgi:hypothetical protein
MNQHTKVNLRLAGIMGWHNIRHDPKGFAFLTGSDKEPCLLGNKDPFMVDLEPIPDYVLDGTKRQDVINELGRQREKYPKWNQALYRATTPSPDNDKNRLTRCERVLEILEIEI